MIGQLTAVGVLVVTLTACTPPQSPAANSAAAPFTSTGTCHARHINPADPQAWEPDPTCTPGSTEGGLTIDQICPVAHTRQIRPPVSYTEPIKRAQMAAYGATMPISNYEEDHVISLELGGSPRDKRNLWPEPHQSPNEKDAVERAAHTYLCEHPEQLSRIQHEMATDWYALGRELHAVS